MEGHAGMGQGMPGWGRACWDEEGQAGMRRGMPGRGGACWEVIPWKEGT